MTTQQVAHTPGAIRAGRNISERFRRALPHLPESNAETLAAIIDAETAAPELLEALKLASNVIGFISDRIPSNLQIAETGETADDLVIRLDGLISKAETGQ